MEHNYPGGTVGGVPIFNGENRAYVEDCNARQSRIHDAAPDLLAALEAWLAANHTPETYDAAIKQARAAIEKARHASNSIEPEELNSAATDLSEHLRALWAERKARGAV